MPLFARDSSAGCRQASRTPGLVADSTVVAPGGPRVEAGGRNRAGEPDRAGGNDDPQCALGLGIRESRCVGSQETNRNLHNRGRVRRLCAGALNWCRNLCAGPGAASQHVLALAAHLGQRLVLEQVYDRPWRHDVDARAAGPGRGLVGPRSLAATGGTDRIRRDDRSGRTRNRTALATDLYDRYSDNLRGQAHALRFDSRRGRRRALPDRNILARNDRPAAAFVRLRPRHVRRRLSLSRPPSAGGWRSATSLSISDRV